jgi:leader peptidase (prepilin peptidase) / N-methyltransferase
MTYVALSILGLCLGSFVNALVWRIYQQEQAGHREKVRGRSKKNNKLSAHSSDLSRSLSILQGRSMCPSCKHELAAKDLVPILSWLQLKGRCRYCQKPISVQYPLVEVATAVMYGSLY